MLPRREIRPGVGAGPFQLGMTREQAWALTDSHVLAYLGKSGPGERSDDFLTLGIHAHYQGGRIARLAVFARFPKLGLAPVELDGDDISGFTREEVGIFLELRELPRVEDIEQIRVPGLGLVFGFRHDFEQPELLEYVFVEAAT